MFAVKLHARCSKFSIFTAIFIDFKGIPNIFPQKSGERIADTWPNIERNYLRSSSDSGGNEFLIISSSNMTNSNLQLEIRGENAKEIFLTSTASRSYFSGTDRTVQVSSFTNSQENGELIKSIPNDEPVELRLVTSTIHCLLLTKISCNLSIQPWRMSKRRNIRYY